MTVIALGLLALLAWAYLMSGAGMPMMQGMAQPSFATVVGMWCVMMVAMMVPAAAPTILIYGQVHRHSKGIETPPPTAAFLGGYLACWLGFAVIAGTLQFWLVSPMMAIGNRDAAGALLIIAGLYQLSPLKDACLGRCRSPAQFLSRHYRPGAFGAVRLGLLHGAYCVGCCWLLMALLFVGGVMNLIWVAGLTLLVAAEKLLPGGHRLALIAGIAMILWGISVILG